MQNVKCHACRQAGKIKNDAGMMEKFICLFVILSFCLTSSCKRDTPLPYPDRGYSYFPVTVGHWVIYSVDSIIYDYNIVTKTSHFELREVIESEFTDTSGRPTQRIERYIRKDSTQSWIIKDVWIANRTVTTTERVEENQRFIKLIFPVKAADTWNGNAYNSLGKEEYIYSEADVLRTVNNLTFDSTLTVTHRDIKNLVETKYSAEIYAKGVGMIKKEFKDLETNINSTIFKGVEYKMEVISYKNW